MSTSASPAETATIVTQTRVVPGQEVAFTVWQEKISTAAGGHPGFIDQKVIPPSPPAQIDWVILQRFDSMESARLWLHSDTRAKLLETAQPMLVGNDDIHIVRDDARGVLPSPASAVISTRVKPGREDEYRQWERRMAAVQANAPGFQGYRIEPPVPGVQESWLAIVRFDSDDHLDQWMKSPERLGLLSEGDKLSDEVRARIVRTGFDQWFAKADAAAGNPSPAWKQNMLVLLQLYPVVFLFGYLVQVPLLQGKLGLPFWLALFIGNVVSVILLNWLVPWTGNRFAWWLQPDAAKYLPRLNWLGAGLIVALYAITMLCFSLLH